MGYCTPSQNIPSPSHSSSPTPPLHFAQIDYGLDTIMCINIIHLDMGRTLVSYSGIQYNEAILTRAMAWSRTARSGVNHWPSPICLSRWLIITSNHFEQPTKMSLTINTYRMWLVFVGSLRSKRFCGVSEQRETRNGIFGVFCAIVLCSQTP